MTRAVHGHSRQAAWPEVQACSGLWRPSLYNIHIYVKRTSKRDTRTDRQRQRDRDRQAEIDR